MPEHTFIVAEAGVNHGGSLDTALSMVDTAAAAGADAVKFQTFRARALVTADAPRAAYQRRTGQGRDQLSLLSELELTSGDHGVLVQRCADRGIEFMSSPFCVDSLRLLVDSCGVARIKLGSGEITHGALLLAAARTGLPLIISTGMSTEAEIEQALGLIAFGRLEPRAAPSSTACAEALGSDAGRRALATVTLLHCTTAYPTPLCDANLLAIPAMRERFGVSVGWSDHTVGTTVAVAAVALGATVIEKHFTLDPNSPGPDHAASLPPAALGYLVRRVREVGLALGKPAKGVAASEQGQRALARRGLVAARAITAGEVIDITALTAKRPAVGASPMRLWELAGSVAERDYAPDEPIDITPRRKAS